MHISLFSTVALLSATALAQIPPSFSPSAATQLGVAYGAVKVTPGQQLAITVPVSAPVLGFNTTTAPINTTARYIVFMIDPDAPTPANASSAQILHWMATDFHLTSVPTALVNTTFPQALTNTSAALIPYRQPAPPVTSPAHRYIQYLFAQPANFTVPAAFAGFSATNRSMFNLTQFVAAAHLGAPVAANYFLCSNMTAAANASASASASSSSSSRATAAATATATATTAKPAAFTGGAAAVAGSGVRGLWSAAGVVGVVAAFAL